jgi:hypothetical protein
MSVPGWSLAVPLVLGLLAAAPGGAQDMHPPAATTADSIERRLESIGTLLERSSAARQVELSGVPQSLDKRDRARELYRQARVAHAAGKETEASELLTQASRLMLDAVHAASAAAPAVGKAKTDYLNRSQSVKALLGAYQRVAAEKGVGSRADEVVQAVQKLTQDAARHAAAADYEEANTTIQRAYLTAKAAVGNLRQGDTLVRSLEFASKEEEYRYELDRNDTHQMLVKVLLEERRGAKVIDPRVRGFLENGGQKRGLAEAKAARGEFEAAVKQMEEATAELVRAIRAAGIFIPG